MTPTEEFKQRNTHVASVLKVGESSNGKRASKGLLPFLFDRF